MTCKELKGALHATPQSGGPAVSLRALFWSFLKIGLFTFGGGYAMIPLIRREVIDRRGWIPEKHFLELLTLAQSAPGPISLNTSVFVGYTTRGLRGALASIAGVILPSFVIILVVAIFFAQISHNPIVQAAFKGMKPAVVALIVAPIFGLARGLGYKRLILAAAAALLVWRFHLSPIWFIIVGAVGGVLYTRLKIRRQ